MQKLRMFFFLFCVLGEVAASNINYYFGLQQMQRPKMFFLLFCVLGEAAASNADYSLGLQHMQRLRSSSFSSVYLAKSKPLMLTIL